MSLFTTIKEFFSKLFGLRPKGWYFQYGKPDPKMNADGVSANWTADPYVEPHYWMKSWSTPLKKSQTITITYEVEAVSGNPVVESTQCKPGQNRAAKAALMIRMNTDNTQLFNRAWYGVRPPMTIGTHTITAPLSGEGWGFVFEKTAGNMDKWDTLLKGVRDIGLTFNGCSSAGHGAYVVGGTVRVKVVSLKVA